MAANESEAAFKKDMMGKLLTMFFKDEKTKAGNDAVILMAELLNVFVVEAARRAMKQAENEDCRRVDLEHVEKILPQLLLDF
ncbi:centromere protein X isoform X2 [Astyanax mexicanus]|uniref:Centromere protein X n=2 Tax=Astyanax mexicanus TaxID=7994 RepID=A0A8T2L1R1_ASTMX|nr:centromere protein X isoform X2 [Astyanax mexicanus]KAG9263965.1 centromere protein X isoform X2 [Astyanax mexicanus]